MKTVYFACAVAGGRDYAFVYKDVVELIKSSGARVRSELFADPELEAATGTNPDMPPSGIYKRDVKWLSEADAFIAEATQPSLGVGYEIALAESINKPTLVLFYKKDPFLRFSPMIIGNPNVKTVEYTNLAEAEKAIQDFIAKLD